MRDAIIGLYISRKRFGIEAVRESDSDVQYHTGLPSTVIFYRLLNI